MTVIPAVALRGCATMSDSDDARPTGPTTARSPASPCPRWGRWRPSRSTSWPTPPSSGTSAPARWRAWPWPGRCSPPRSACSTSSRTPPPRAVARQLGAGHRREAAESGVDGCWLAVGLGVVLTVLGVALAPADRRRDGRVDERARRSRSPTCASASSGAPALLLALAGAGYLRGMQDTKHHARDRGARQRGEPAARAAVRLRARPRHRGLGVGHRARAVRRRHRVRRDRRARGRRAERVVAAAARPASAPTRPSAAGWSCAPRR